MARLKVTETRVGYIDVNLENYPSNERTIAQIIEIERNNHAENVEFMDWLDADSVATFELVNNGLVGT
jgi:hypothetical protein